MSYNASDRLTDYDASGGSDSGADSDYDPSERSSSSSDSKQGSDTDSTGDTLDLEVLPDIAAKSLSPAMKTTMKTTKISPIAAVPGKKTKGVSSVLQGTIAIEPFTPLNPPKTGQRRGSSELSSSSGEEQDTNTGKGKGKSVQKGTKSEKLCKSEKQCKTKAPSKQSKVPPTSPKPAKLKFKAQTTASAVPKDTPPKLTQKGTERERDYRWTDQENYALFYQLIQLKKEIRLRGRENVRIRQDAWDTVLATVNSVHNRKNGRQLIQMRKHIDDFFGRLKPKNKQMVRDLKKGIATDGCSNTEVMCLQYKDIREIAAQGQIMFYNPPETPSESEREVTVQKPKLHSTKSTSKSQVGEAGPAQSGTSKASTSKAKVGEVKRSKLSLKKKPSTTEVIDLCSDPVEDVPESTHDHGVDTSTIDLTNPHVTSTPTDEPSSCQPSRRSPRLAKKSLAFGKEDTGVKDHETQEKAASDHMEADHVEAVPHAKKGDRVSALESLVIAAETARQDTDKHVRALLYRHTEVHERYVSVLERLSADRDILLRQLQVANQNQKKMLEVQASLVYFIEGKKTADKRIQTDDAAMFIPPHPPSATVCEDAEMQTDPIPLLDAVPLVVTSVTPSVHGSDLSVSTTVAHVETPVISMAINGQVSVAQGSTDMKPLDLSTESQDGAKANTVIEEEEVPDDTTEPHAHLDESLITESHPEVEEDPTLGDKDVEQVQHSPAHVKEPSPPVSEDRRVHFNLGSDRVEEEVGDGGSSSEGEDPAAKKPRKVTVQQVPARVRKSRRRHKPKTKY